MGWSWSQGCLRLANLSHWNWSWDGLTRGSWSLNFKGTCNWLLVWLRLRMRMSSMMWGMFLCIGNWMCSMVSSMFIMMGSMVVSMMTMMARTITKSGHCKGCHK